MKHAGATPAGLIGWLLLAACAAQESAPAIDFAVEEEAVRGVEMAFLDFAKRRDATGAATVFTDDAVLFRENRDLVTGITAVQMYLAEEYGNLTPDAANGQTSEVQHTRVASSGETAYQYGVWTTPGSEGGPGPDRGYYLSVYHKVNGVWKIAIDMSLSTRPEAPATPSDPD